jgi:cell division transport system permease protein
MQLVGAKSSFIRKPFLLKAIYQGFLSGLLAIIALVSLWYIFTSFNPTIIVKLSMNDDLLYSELTEFGIIASGIIITGIIISLGSTYFALNKYIWIKSEKLH